MIPNKILSESFEILPFNDSIVTVTLRSISHHASLPIGSLFNIRFVVNNGVQMLDFSQNVVVFSGSTFTVNGENENFVFEDTSCAELRDRGLTFFAHVTTPNASACVDFHATGRLIPGRQIFRMPIVLTSQGRESRLVFRGTIHTSCPEV